MINVTRPFLPPQEEYQNYLDGIWKRSWLTNNGPLVNDLELKLKEYLGMDHLLYLANGTIALQIAIKALGLKGEVITTPFSFVATTSSIIWENCTPVFVDIDEGSFNIDVPKIEAAISSNTSAILATHVFGNACEIEAIDRIAKRYNLKVIYDAAHCFGTMYKGKSIFKYGDVCTTSFHATKLFHTIEGGAVFTDDPHLLRKMSFMRNFGFNGSEDFAEVGINGKNSEFHAAMGLANLKYISELLNSRKNQSLRYDGWLKQIESTRIVIEPNCKFNYAYYPLVLPTEELASKIIRELERNKVFPRRYFYPGLNSVKIFNGGQLPVCDSLTKRIMCLPLYHTLSNEEIDFVCRIIIRTYNYDE